MTIKEIAELCGVTEQTVVNWSSETSLKFRDVLNQKIQDAYQIKKPADFTLEETLAIIGEGGGNKTLAALLAENAANKNALSVQRKHSSGGISADITKKINALIEQNEQNQAILARVGTLIDDPHEEAYRELEKWVKTHLAPTHDKRFGRVWVHNIYKEFTYNTRLRFKISEHDVMFKIALDHPEFELTTSRKEWFFIGCNML